LRGCAVFYNGARGEGVTTRAHFHTLADHAFIAGKKAADQVKESSGRKMISGLVAGEWQGQQTQV
jgi:hypothetical protein